MSSLRRPLCLALVGTLAPLACVARHAPESTAMSVPASSADRAPSSLPGSLAIRQRQIPVLDTVLAYRESGEGPPLVFLHGNPTSSYVWRDVLPAVSALARCLAPDLVGMGDSGKPETGYRFADHARYLDAFYEALGLRDLVLVGYDWGGALALDWAARHPTRVRGVVVFETFLRPLTLGEWPPAGADLFRRLRTPGVGEALVLERNEFLARSLENGVKTGLSDEARAVYAAPYPDARSRRPLLQWPREIPIDGAPADVAGVVARYGAWLGASPEVPKLLLTFETGTPLGSTASVAWARANVPGLVIEALGVAGHHAPEDRGPAIGAAIASFLRRERLGRPSLDDDAGSSP